MEGNIGVTGERGDERRWTRGELGDWAIGRMSDWVNGRSLQQALTPQKSLVRCSSIDAKIFFEIDSVRSMGGSVLIQS